jgi:hypothetical protein
MNIPSAYVRIAMVCAVIYGMLIAGIQLGLFAREEDSVVLLYWALMPTIWIAQKIVAGVLEKPPIYLIAGINTLLFFSIVYGVTKAIERMKENKA